MPVDIEPMSLIRERAVEVVPGAMTRVAAPGSKLVNISSGGKMKDTWVLV